jgi:hypothetical protein
MITLTTDRPFQDAVETMAGKTPVGSPLTSAEWDLLPGEVKLRLMFSSTVEDERILAEMQARLQDRVNLEKRDGRTVDRVTFIDEMHRILRESGYKRPDGVRKGSLQDLKSARRLGLVWDMNLAQAQGYSRWKAGMDPDVLLMVPCRELIRVLARVEHRDWPRIWEMAGGEFYGGYGSNPDYPNSKGRMMARADDEIWVRISRFGVPWEPFDWGSGMGTRNVRRKLAEQLGVIQPGERVTPLDTPFNDGVKASLATVPQSARQRILDALAGDVEILDDEVRIIPPERIEAMGGGEKRRLDLPFDGVKQPAPKPDGKSLLEVVTVKGSKPVHEAVRRAIALADAVHGDGVLPPVEFTIRKPVFRPGAAGLYAGVPSPDQTPTLLVSPAAINPEMSALHEMGHFLDNLGLHTPTPSRVYASQGQPELRDLMRELRFSTAAGRLAAMVQPGSYYLRPQELFARAYAQFIAEQSGDEMLKAFIAEIRAGQHVAADLPAKSQWSWADFNSISRAMRALFNRAGWKSGQ